MGARTQRTEETTMIIKYDDAQLIAFLSTKYDRDIEILEDQAKRLRFRVRNFQTFGEMGWDDDRKYGGLVVRTACGEAIYQIEVNPFNGAWSNDIEVATEGTHQDMTDAYMMICGMLMDLSRHYGCGTAAAWIDALDTETKAAWRPARR